MPTKLPRFLVTVTEEQDQLLRQLAEMQHRSVASFLRELLDAATPMLRASVPLLKAARTTVQEQPQALREAAEGYVRAVAFYDDQIDIEEVLAAIQGPAAGEGEPPSSNTGVRMEQDENESAKGGPR